MAVERDELVTSAEFARRAGVSRACVTQWKQDGKISAAAIVGEGRAARIRVRQACEDLRATRDVSQALSLNGAGTRLDFGGAAGGDDSASPLQDGYEARLKAEKLREIEFRNRSAAKREAEEAGLYVRASHHRAAVAKLTTAILKGLEAAVPEMATGLARDLGIPLRDASRTLQAQVRATRVRLEAELARLARGESDAVTDELLGRADAVQGEA